MSLGRSAGYRIERFDPARHDRGTFSYGVDRIDNFFRKTANKLARAGNVRIFVMVDGDGQVVGFYALNAHAVDYRDLPARFARSRPAHGSIPAAFLSMIAVDRRQAGKGLGGDLLVDALLRVTRVADELGIALVMLDILDDGDQTAVQRRKALYERYGFAPLTSDPLRMVLPVATIRTLVDES